jgi:hypothetical protein
MDKLTERELQAVGVMVVALSKLEREDVIGAILKTGAFRCLPFEGKRTMVGLAKKLERAYERARGAVPAMRGWTPIRWDPNKEALAPCDDGSGDEAEAD